MQPQGQRPALPPQCPGRMRHLIRLSQALNLRTLQCHVLHEKRPSVRRVPYGNPRCMKGREPAGAPCRSGTAMGSGITIRGVALRDRGSLIRACWFLRRFGRLMLWFLCVRLRSFHRSGLPCPDWLHRRRNPPLFHLHNRITQSFQTLLKIRLF